MTAGFAHAQSELTYKGGVLKDGTKLAPAKVREIMSGNSEALKMYNSGRALGTTGMIFGGVGGFLVGFDLETRLGGGEGNGTLLAVGGVTLGAGLVLGLIGDANVKKSVTLYNSKLSSNSTPLQINFGLMQTGIGLSMRF